MRIHIPSIPFFFSFFFFHIVNGCFAFKVSVTHACLVPVEAGRGCQILWNWDYRQLWTSTWELGVKPRPLEEQPEFLTAEHLSRPPPDPFQLWGAALSCSFPDYTDCLLMLYLGFAPGCSSPVWGGYNWQESWSLKFVTRGEPRLGMTRKVTGQFAVCLNCKISFSQINCKQNNKKPKP